MNPGSSQFASQFPDAEETMSKMESNGLQTKESIVEFDDSGEEFFSTERWLAGEA